MTGYIVSIYRKDDMHISQWESCANDGGHTGHNEQYQECKLSLE